MRWQLTLQVREGALADVDARMRHYAKRLEKRRNEAEIFNAIQSLVDEGMLLKKALKQVAGHGVAAGKGAETLKNLWQSKWREIDAGAKRLKPAGGIHPFSAEVIPPGRRAKKTGRPKKR